MTGPTHIFLPVNALFPQKLVLGPRYRIERELGAGGMSTVYLAHDLRQDRKVAIKVLRADIAAGIGAERFVREIRLTARLTHPHILPLLDSGETNGMLYYAMPYMPGESLRDRLEREGALPVRDAVQIARETGDALAYAHAQGIVHRDIKPDNILLAAGHAVVADFGIADARMSGVDEGLTSTGLAVGSPAYMSPEQSMAEPIDGRTDVYALGCVLFEMLTGETPITAGSTVGLISKKLSMDAPLVTTIRPGTPAHVAQAIARALMRDADKRFATAAEFVKALEVSDIAVPWVIAEAPQISVAVLPFTSRGGSPADAYLCDGLSEEIIHALTRLRGVRVIGRTSSFAFRDETLDLKSIADQLKVQRIVEGSVRIAGSNLRVAAQVTDPHSGVQLWSERYDRKLDDIFAIQDEIAAAIATSLREVLQGRAPTGTTQEFPAAHPTSSVEAYENYLRGRFFFAMRTEEGLRRSIHSLMRAIELDQSFALAHAALADAWAMLGLYGMAAPEEAMPSAKLAANVALALNPSLGEALAARASVSAIFDFEWEPAAADFQRAIEASPQYPTALQGYAMNYFVPLARFTNAKEVLERARVLDPLSLSITVSGIAIDYYARDHAAAIRGCEEAIRADEHFAMTHYFLGLALEQDGAASRSAQALERAATLSPSSEILTALARARMLAGDAAGAQAVRDQVVERSRERYVSPVLLAQLDLAFGDEALALAKLADARDRRAADLIWAGVRPTFDPLRTVPEFRSLLDALRLPNIG